MLNIILDLGNCLIVGRSKTNLPVESAFILANILATGGYSASPATGKFADNWESTYLKCQYGSSIFTLSVKQRCRSVVTHGINGQFSVVHNGIVGAGSTLVKAISKTSAAGSWIIMVYKN